MGVMGDTPGSGTHPGATGCTPGAIEILVKKSSRSFASAEFSPLLARGSAGGRCSEGPAGERQRVLQSQPELPGVRSIRGPRLAGGR